MVSLSQIEILLPELRAYATSISASHDSSEDLVQGAIERALSANNSPSRLDDLRPWMCKVIKNLYYDKIRKRKVRQNYADTQKHFHNDSRPCIEQLVFFRLGFEKLSPSMQRLLLMADIMGMKYAEIAEVVGIPQGTVMSRLNRARNTLRKIVTDETTA